MVSPVVVPAQAPLFAKVGLGCSVAFIILFELCMVIIRKCTPKDTKTSAIVFLASGVGSIANAMATSPFASYAMWQMLHEEEVSLVMKSPDELIVAAAIACGYFVGDCYQMIRYHEENLSEFGGRANLILMWGHHSLSLVFWPYAVLTHRDGIFVAFYLFTELTNILQNAFHFCNKLGASFTVLLTVGVSWIASFAICRILPMPWFVYQYVKLLFLQDVPSGVTTFDLVVTLLTVPLPFLLNTYWFRMLVKKALRMAKGDVAKKTR